MYSTSVAGDKIDCHADEGPSGGWEETSSNYKPEIVSVWIIQNVGGLTAPELTIYYINCDGSGTGNRHVGLVMVSS
jgi:hypothetical protein